MDLHHHNSNSGSLSEMNLTPLVDVMMVLMIIFMVTSSTDPAGIDLDLPDTQTPMAAKALDVLTIYMELNGTVTVTLGPKKQVKTTVERLTVTLEQHFPGLTEANIKGDRRLPYEKIMGLLVKARLAGIKKMGLLMDQVAQPQGEHN